MGCPGDNEIADFVEGRCEDAARAAIAEHLDACDGCRELVGLAARAVAGTQPEAPRREDGLPDRGDAIGCYRVLGRLGRGAMGLVLAAEHLKLRRRVALKIVLPGAEGRAADAQLRARLVREARAASAVRHPGVVAVHDVLALDDGSPVMVMDLLEGETLRARLDRGRLAPAEAVELVRQLLAALGAAHALGVVHRDLKPDNVFLCAGASGVQAKIVDFGIAKLTAIDGPAAATAGLTHTGMLVGTPHYMAPEQAFADGELDARADLWAIGVILYECLAGRRPFEGDSVGQVLRRLARLSYEPLPPEVPASLARLCERLMRERHERPASAAEVAAELDALPPSSRSLGPARAAEPPRFSSESAGGLTLTAASWVRAERGWLLGVASAAVVAALVLVAWPRPGAEVLRPAGRALAYQLARADVVPAAAPSTPAPVASAAPVPRLPRVKPSAAVAPSAVPSSGPGQLITEPPF